MHVCKFFDTSFAYYSFVVLLSIPSLAVSVFWVVWYTTPLFLVTCIVSFSTLMSSEAFFEGFHLFYEFTALFLLSLLQYVYMGWIFRGEKGGGWTHKSCSRAFLIGRERPRKGWGGVCWVTFFTFKIRVLTKGKLL